MARRANSLPMRPIPITPSVLLYSSTPSKFFLSQFFFRMLASACGIFRATQSKSEKACSAVETVFPPGALSTTIPRRVAASTSTLSTPTPARPTTRSFVPAFKIFELTFVSLRMMIALNSGMRATSSGSVKAVFVVSSRALSRASSSMPRGEMASAMRTRGVVIAEVNVQQPALSASRMGSASERSMFNSAAVIPGRARLQALTEDQQLNRIWQLLGNIRGHAATEEIGKGGPLRRTDDEKIDAHGGGKIDNRRGGILAHRINRHDADITVGSKFKHERHDGVRLRVVLPACATESGRTAGIINGDLFDIKHTECRFAQLRFVEGKTEHRRDAACRNHDFLSFLQPRLHRCDEIG